MCALPLSESSEGVKIGKKGLADSTFDQMKKHVNGHTFFRAEGQGKACFVKLGSVAKHSSFYPKLMSFTNFFAVFVVLEIGVV